VCLAALSLNYRGWRFIGYKRYRGKSVMSLFFLLDVFVAFFADFVIAIRIGCLARKSSSNGLEIC